MYDEIVDATIFKGYGVASKNIKFQMAHLVWQFPEIKDIYPATINVRLDKPFLNLSYDHTTLTIPWWDTDEQRRGDWQYEKFSFLRIEFEYPIDGPRYRAWIFGCHNSRWFNDELRLTHEVIAEKVPNLSYNTRCRIVRATG